MTLQYTRPVTTGESSPAVTAHHHFVHESQAFLDAAKLNQRMPTLMRGKGEEISIAVTFGDASRFLRKICHAFPVPFPRTLQ